MSPSRCPTCGRPVMTEELAERVGYEADPGSRWCWAVVCRTDCGEDDA